MRVHEIAKKHKKTSKEVLTVCKALSIEAKAHMTALSTADTKKVEKELKGSSKTKAPTKKKVAKKKTSPKKEKPKQEKIKKETPATKEKKK